MVTLPDTSDRNELWVGNAPWSFWKLQGEPFDPLDWAAAGRQAVHCLEGLPVAAQHAQPFESITDILSERQFGPRHLQFSSAKRLYYQVVRPILPERFRPFIHQIALRRPKDESHLKWPIEDRFVRFQFEMLRQLLICKQQTTVPYIHFWPHGKQFALVLTHDVESDRGQQFVRQLAALEERYGFRSSFNFVPEAYHVDGALRGELKERSFEIGVHGLKHDGKDFLSKQIFLQRAQHINTYVKTWGAVGFRAPLTHRNPEWMQALEIEYDLSFFDTDPYEPFSGGTLNIWPFFVGRFVELPYTLVQDHTLMMTLGETTPRLWLDKVEFIARYGGLALVNAHPDYLLREKHLAIYEEFLRQLHRRTDYWHALPREAARWWRRRAGTEAINDQGRWIVRGATGATVGEIRLNHEGPANSDSASLLVISNHSTIQTNAVAQPHGMEGGVYPTSH